MLTFWQNKSKQFSYAVYSSKCPESFRFANITPAFKNGSRNEKDNILP